jgi:hypothetical protein
MGSSTKRTQKEKVIMNAIYSEWNPKLMEVFSPKELIILENILMYIQYENNIAYQDSIYETTRDSNEESPNLDSIPGEDREVQEYQIINDIQRKLIIIHESMIGEIPENLFTEPKYSSNMSNQFRQAIGG